MSLVYPSTPLNAQDAKLIADQALLDAKKVATDAWLANASVVITSAAKAGAYAVSLSYDSTINTQQVIQQLVTVLGYSATIFSGTNLIKIDWQSVARSKVTPDSNPDSNFGYEQPNSN